MELFEYYFLGPDELASAMYTLSDTESLKLSVRVWLEMAGKNLSK
jgi:hypothetical protein